MLNRQHIQLIHVQPKHWLLSLYVTPKYFLPLYVTVWSDDMQVWSGGVPCFLSLVFDCVFKVKSRAVHFNNNYLKEKTRNFTVFCSQAVQWRHWRAITQVSLVYSHGKMRVCVLLSRESATVCLPLLPACLVLMSSAVTSLCFPVSAFHVAVYITHKGLGKLVIFLQWQKYFITLLFKFYMVATLYHTQAWKHWDFKFLETELDWKE